MELVSGWWRIDIRELENTVPVLKKFILYTEKEANINI